MGTQWGPSHPQQPSPLSAHVYCGQTVAYLCNCALVFILQEKIIELESVPTLTVMAALENENDDERKFRNSIPCTTLQRLPDADCSSAEQ